MPHDPRDQLWEGVFDTYYESYYQELESEKLVGCWQRFDDAVKTVVAITASSSAVSGWALWSQPGYRTIWGVIAGIGALFAIVHAALGVPNRLKEWGDIQRWFVLLRIDLETLRYRMAVNPEFMVDEVMKDFETLRRRYGEGVQRVRNDFLRTDRMRIRTQAELNDRISDKIQKRPQQ